MKVIISGGGTGGHIFPAIAIANELKNRVPGVEILFVGATGRMEMERVPSAGYRIVGLPIRGFQRKLSLPENSDADVRLKRTAEAQLLRDNKLFERARDRLQTLAAQYFGRCASCHQPYQSQQPAQILSARRCSRRGWICQRSNAVPSS